MFLNNLASVLKSMNHRFGEGEIASITINMEESRPSRGEWFGVVKRRLPWPNSYLVEEQGRLFKVSDRTVTFLSRKRKLEV